MKTARIYWTLSVLSLLSYAGPVFAYGPTPAAKLYNIEDFGAKGDGVSLNTEIIQLAIDQAFNDGGGRVVIPEGKFLSGSIVLKSNVTLHLQRNATLLGSVDPFDYKRIGSSMKGLVLADNAKNVAITGAGVIDGQGRALALRVDSLYHAGVIRDPGYSIYTKRPSEHMRPTIINFVRCENVRVEGVTIQHASGWVQVYEQCDTLTIDRIRVESTAYWNNDGIDVIDSKNVRITNSLVNAADDGICLKSNHAQRMCEDVYIANCTVRSSASAIKFGTASRGGFRNVRVENITIYDTYRSAIALQSVDGGIMEDIEISNVRAFNTGNAFAIRLGHRVQDAPVGKLRNVTMKNIFVQVPYNRPDDAYDIRGPALPFFHNPMPASIAGIPGHLIENVTLEDITVIYPGGASKGMALIPLNRLDDVPENVSQYPEFSMFGELPAWGLYVRHVTGLSLKNIHLEVKGDDFRPAMVFDDVSNLNLYHSTIYPTDFHSSQIVLQNVQSPTVQGTMIKGVEGHGVYALQSDTVCFKP